MPFIENIKFSDEGTRARFTLPGMSPDFIDRTGNIQLCKISKLFECGRVTTVKNPNFFTRKILTGSDKSVFIVVMNMDIDRNLYKKMRRNLWLWPVDLTTTVTSFGKSSIDYVSTIEDTKDKSLLGTLRFKYAAVDLKTRKSFILPESVKEPFLPYQKPDLATVKYSPATRPPNAYCLTLVVKPSDIDFNRHLNNTIYIRMCTDSATEASLAGHFVNFNGDMALYEARHVDALYLSECRLGDEVSVYSWEDNEHTDTLHFEIKRKDKTSFYSRIDFYPKTTSARL